MYAGGHLDDADTEVPANFLPPLLGDLSHGSLLSNSTLEDSTVDTRRFRSGAVILGRGGLAVEKTLRYVFGATMSNESRDTDSITSESLHALSIGPGMYKGPQLNSLTDAQRLTTNCWEAFQACALHQGDYPMDGGSKGIPVASLVSAIRRVSKSLSPQELTVIVHERQYPSNAFLSFKEFQSLILSLFSKTSSAPPKPSPIKKALPSTWNIGETTATHIDYRDKSAFQRLMQKNRGASSVVLSLLPPEASTDIGITESLVEMDGQKVSASKVNEAMLQVFRNDARFRKIERKNAELSAGGCDGAFVARKNIDEPLLKDKVYGMTHAEATYAAKWERMRVKREERTEREIKRATRSDMIETLNRLVLVSEKRGIKGVKERREIELLESAKVNVAIKLSEQQEANERIWRRKEETLGKNRNAALQLKGALSEASLFSKSLIEEEMDEKKSKVVPFQLSPSSSALIKVPEELIVTVKRAKSLESYNAAKKAEKDFWEQTLDNRIKRFSNAKYEKMFKAADIGVRIAITPFTPLYSKPLSSPARKPDSKAELAHRYGIHSNVMDHRDMHDDCLDDQNGAKVADEEEEELEYAMREYINRKNADDDSVNSNRRSPTNTVTSKDDGES